MKWRYEPLRRGRGITERAYTGCPEAGITLTIRYDRHLGCWFGNAEGKLSISWRRLSAYPAGAAMQEWERETAALVRAARRP